MSKIKYLDSHLEKFREKPEIKIDLEEVCEIVVEKGNYPNTAFEQHNHMKKILVLRGRMSSEEFALVPRVEQRVKKEKKSNLLKAFH